ncbi:signal peptidase I [Tersicoccus sp. MR15.9]|uniref:signal peptidase I n=1 Tax=Tersicoccus mangrovi TaxID=3121635 RepID=UPI002FE69E58
MSAPERAGAAPGPSRPRPGNEWMRGAVLSTAAVAVAAALITLVVVPRVLGWVPLTVLSGSMSPTIPTGSQVVVRPVQSVPDMARLSVGDVITFAPRNDDDGTLVTHRIVAVGMDAVGAPSFTTLGDANPSADADPVGPAQLRGVVEYHVPGAGWLATAVSPGQKKVGVHVGAVLLLAYAAGQLYGVLRRSSWPRLRLRIPLRRRSPRSAIDVA